jgi:putative SOS response-associated peptidase YedK
MCNLYRMTGNAQAIAQLFAADTAGRNLPPFHEIFPDQMAPVVVAHEGARRLDMMRWGWPPFGQVKRPVTNIRNLDSPMWRGALADPARRCLVPVTEFSEWSLTPDPATGRKRKHWFTMRNEPLFAFAGLWRPTPEGARFAFLTCAANATVGAVHPKAMPVMLRPGADCDRWLSAPLEQASALQCPFPDAEMHEVAPDDPPRDSNAEAAPAQGKLL